MVSTRRSSAVLCGTERKLSKCKTYVKHKKMQKRPCEELQQQQPQQHQEEEDYLLTPPPSPLTPGHKDQAEVALIGGVEVIPLDICSSPEQTKPEVDHLSRLQPVSKVPCHIEVPQRSFEILVDAAVVFKNALVAYLEKTAHNLDIADMVKSANECFTRLSTLQVNYRPFHGEVCKFIKYHHELKEKSAETDLELEANYENSVIHADDMKEGLLIAENKLISAQTNHNSTTQRIEALKEALARLETEDARERDVLATLTAERDHCNEAYLLAEKMVEQMASRRQEPAAILEGIKTQFNDKIQRSLNRLHDLV